MIQGRLKPHALGRGFAVILATALAAGPALAGSAPTVLSGTLRVFMCEDPHCERPADSAPGWRSHALGPRGIAGSLEQREGVGWAILSFPLSRELAAIPDPALLITSPADAEVATYNGVPTGGEGVIGPRYLAVPGGPRLLVLPPAAVHAGPNELALKVLFAEVNTKAFSGPILFGQRDRIELEREVLRRPLLTSEAAFMSLFLVMIVFFSFLISRGVVRSDDVLFSAFLVIYTASFVLDSHLLDLSGLASPRLEHFQAIIMRVLSLVVLSLVTTISGQRFGRTYKLFAAAAIAMLLAVIVLQPLQALQWLVVPRKIMLGMLGAYYLFLVARAMYERRPDAGPVFVGVVAYVAGSRLDLYWGIAARDYGTGIFALAMLYTITSRHARLRARVEEISARLLDAHEEERRRIARDIHDSVGQSLLALRLKLQMSASKFAPQCAAAGETLPALAAETGAIVDELRRTVLDLRPAITETPGVAPAFQAYASAVAVQRGWELCFHEGQQPIPDLPARVRTHLFRVFQEMLANIQRHAGAMRVDISLYRDGSRLVLQVSDDGRGFDPDRPADPGGIGLETMRERAELLGGTLAIESEPQRGTAVTVEIPLQ